jgi:hypothetical protein
MASTHKHIRSSTVNKRPTTAIAEGQIALNTNATSPGLFFKDSTGATIIKIGPVHVGATAPNASPAAGGSSGNSTGEIWLDNSLTPVGVKIWNGSAWVNATPTGTTTVAGLLELATDAETQTGSDTARAVTPASLQSKLSDSTSTTSSITIASSTAVKSAYDLANAALPKSGGTVTGALEIGSSGSLVFEGSTADDFETTLAVTDPTADRTITLPDVNGTVVTTGDTGTVTSAMIADGTIVNADISASAEIAVSKLADGAARQVLQTDAAGTGVEWTDSIALPGSATATSFSPTGSSVPTNGFYLPTTNNVAISSNGTQRLLIEADGDINIDSGGVFYDATNNRLAIGTTSPSDSLHVGTTTTGGNIRIVSSSDGVNGQLRLFGADGVEKLQIFSANTGAGVYTGVVPFQFYVANQERARIDSSGRLLVGTSTASTAGTSKLLQVVDSSGGAIGLGRTSATSIGANEFLGGIDWLGAGLTPSAHIWCYTDAAQSSTSDLPSRLVFSTTKDGQSSPTEHMRVESSGTFRTFCSDSTSSGHLQAHAGSAGSTYPLFEGKHSAASITGGTTSFKVTTDGNVTNTNNSYGAISDIKLKENIVDANSQWDDLKALQVRNYNFKEGQTHTQIGLIAQEVELVSPGLVSESPDRDAEGNDLGTTTKSVNYSVLYMKAVKALQEAMERIEVLEAKVNALEGN